MRVFTLLLVLFWERGLHPPTLYDWAEKQREAPLALAVLAFPGVVLC